METVGQITTPTITLVPDVIKVDIAQLQPTSRPIEDRFSLNYDASRNRLIVGVYDGHGGSETAQYVSDELPRRLLQHSRSRDMHIQQFEALDECMLRNFKRDHSLFRRKSARWLQNAQVVKSGSMALILDVDLGTLSANYANLGDCRLVIRDFSLEGSRAFSLQTEDMNMNTAAERERLIREHPNENQMIIANRLFGRLMSTRGALSIASLLTMTGIESSLICASAAGFGDGYYKLPNGILGQHRKYIDTLSSIERPGKIPMNWQYAPLFCAYKTPPYIIARPETGTWQLEKGSLVILATDGLWDLISSEQAIEIVLRGLSTDGVEDLAKYLLHEVKTMKAPGDDVTLIVLRV